MSSYNSRLLTRAFYTIQIIDDSILYKADLYSTNGNIFQPHDTHTDLSVRIMKNSDDITSEFSDIVWRRFTFDASHNPDEDKAWGDKHKGKQIITVTKADVSGKAKIQCEIYKTINGDRTLVAATDITIIDVNDFQPSETAPTNPIDGQIWIDSSVNPPLIKMWNAHYKMWYIVGSVEPALRNVIRNSNFFMRNTNLWTINKASSNFYTEIHSVQNDDYALGTAGDDNAYIVNRKWLRLRLDAGSTSINGVSQIKDAKSNSVYTIQNKLQLYRNLDGTVISSSGKLQVMVNSIDSNGVKTLLDLKNTLTNATYGKSVLFAAGATSTLCSLYVETLKDTEKLEVIYCCEYSKTASFMISDVMCAAIDKVTDWELAPEDVYMASQVNMNTEDIFNALTENGKQQGIYYEYPNGNKTLYVSGEFIQAYNLKAVLKSDPTKTTFFVNDKGEVTINASSFNLSAGGTSDSFYTKDEVYKKDDVYTKTESDKEIKDTVDDAVKDITDELDTIKTDIDTVKKDITDNNNLVSDILNDDKITPNEKQEIRRLRSQMVNERTSYATMSALYGVSASAYSNAYTALVTDYIDAKNILQSMTTTTDLTTLTPPSTGNALRTLFVTYNNEKEKLVLAINTAAKAYTTSSVNGIEIGGRNLVVGTSQDRNITGTNTNNQTGTLYNFDSSKYKGKTITISCKYSVSDGATGTARLQAGTPDWTPGSNTVNVETYPSGTLTGLGVKILDNSSFKIFQYRLDNFVGSIRYYDFKVELGNKVTDWTPAPEDFQTQIDDVTGKVSDIIDDSKITPPEKQALYAIHKDIQSEKVSISAQLTAYGLSANTAYDNAYKNLNDKLTEILVTDGMNKTSYVVAATFRALFDTYYSTRDTVLKLIEEASKKFTTDAVNNIKIGGRNLLLNFSQYTEKDKWTTTATRDDWYVYTDGKVYLEKGETYTFSCKTNGVWGTVAGTDTVEAFLREDANPGNHVHMNTNTKTFAHESNAGWYTLRLDVNKSGVTHSFWEVKIEKGNKATDWSPAPEDIQNQIDDIISDTVITPAEKSQLFIVRKDIDAEKNTIVEESKKYKLENTDAYKNYIDKYGSLDVVFNNVLANMSINYDIKMTGDEFRKYFTDYYSMRDILVQAIEVASRTFVTDEANKAVDGLVIGGTNLFFDTKSYANPKYWGNWGANPLEPNTINGFGVVKITGQWGKRSQIVDVLPNTEYTMSAWVKRDTSEETAPTRLGFYIDGYPPNDIHTGKLLKTYNFNHGEAITADEWIRVAATYRTGANTTKCYARYEPWTDDYNNKQPCMYMYGLKLEKGNKPTEWSPAPEDAQEELDNIKTDVTNVTNSVKDVTSDNFVTVSEKQTLFIIMKDIEAEYLSIIEQAKKYNLNTNTGTKGIYDNYVNGYDALSNYFTPIFADMAKSSELVGVTMRNHFNTYYTRRDLLIKLVEQAIKDYTTDSVNGIIIGGRNLLRKSDYLTVAQGDNFNVRGNIYTLSKDTETLYGKGVAKIVGTGPGTSGTNDIVMFPWDRTVNIPINTSYMFSFYMKGTAGTQVTYRLGYGGNNGTITLTENWKKYSVKLSWGTVTSREPIIWADRATTMYISQPKLEFGTKETDWSPAPEDVQEQLDSIELDIDKVKEDVTKVNSFIDDMLADDKITPNEKQELKRQNDIIVNEKTRYAALCALYGVSGSLYETAYTALIDNYIKFYNILQSLTTTTDLKSLTPPSTGAAFRALFVTYNNEKEKLVVAINTAAKKFTTDSVDKVIVGGRNYVANSDYELTGGNEFLRYTDIAPIIDKLGLREYTISFDIKAPVEGDMRVYCQNGSNAKYDIGTWVISITTEYKRYSITTTPKNKDSVTESWLAFYGTYDTGRIPSVKNVKMEIGNKATDWTQAPEDIDDILNNKVDTGGSIEDINKSPGQIDPTRLNIRGAVTFESLSEEIGKNFVAKVDAAGNRVETIINGGRFETGSIKADSLSLYNLAILKKNTQQETFSINDNGEVYAAGTFRSYDFVNSGSNISASRGWQITADGNSLFNNTIVRGRVELPSAGMTNDYDANQLYDRNLILNSGKFTSTRHWQENGGVGLSVVEKDGFKCLYCNGSISGQGNASTFEPNGNYFIELEDDTEYIYSCEIMFDKDITINYSVPLHAWVKSLPSNTHPSGHIISVIDTPSVAKANTWTKIILKLRSGKIDKANGDNWVGLRPFVWTSEALGEFWLKNMSLKKGTIPTEWTPAPEDNTNPVRFWAGASYENNEEAPFRVLQDGTIYATKGHIGGTFTGKLQIGNIEIEDTTSTRGALIIRDDYNINNILARIGEDNSFFRTNLHFQNRETGNVFATMKTDINEFNFSKGSSINLDSGNTNTSIKLIADGLYASVIRMGNVDLCAFDTTARFEHPSLLKPISVTVGSAAVKTSSLNVNGSIQAYNSINLGTKVTMKETSDGIGFFVN